MLADPAVVYAGGISGLPATKPAKGDKIDPTSPSVVKYAGYLASKHDYALGKAGGGEKLYDYTYSYDGFAAKLTEGQAAKLEGQSDILAVTQDELQTMDTSSTPSFLGLDAPGGLWDQLGGPTGGKKGIGAGENIIIGDVDSGIWPESKSFSDRDAAGKLVYNPIGGFHGRCESSEIVTDGSWDTNLCNKKLIAARHFDAAWGGDAAIDAQRPWEFTSPRDYNGHGTHTASTAGGDHGTATTGPAAAFGPVSGMAPRARIAMYKALWSTQDASTASGFTSDLVAAIDQAVADGVDVINYSISGTQTNFLDPVQVSFLFAADAGVFVSASAGNSGPTTGTVAHPGPWLTTVAAGTHNRNGLGSVTLGNAVTYNGASVASAVGPAPLILSDDAGVTGADPTKANLCYASVDNGGTPVLDPAKVAGKIVVCDRGVTARVNKSLAVQEAGGMGMILTNVTPSSLNADFHFVPTVHVSDTDRPAIRAYAATPGATATINQSTLTYTDPAPFTASFSSRSSGGGRRRPAEAGRDRSRPGHPGGGRASGEPRVRLQPLQRHFDVGAPRGRYRRAAEAGPSRLVADDGEVGADDDRLRRPRRSEHEPARDLQAGSGPRAAEQRGRPGARLQQRVQRLAGVPVRNDQRRQPEHVQRTRGSRILAQPERPERGVARDRRSCRHRDADAEGDERREQHRDVYGIGDRHEWGHHRGHAVVADPLPGRDRELHRQVHPHDRGAERVLDGEPRPAHLDGRDARRAQPDRHEAGRPRRSRSGRRDRREHQLHRQVRLRRPVQRDRAWARAGHDRRRERRR